MKSIKQRLYEAIGMNRKNAKRLIKELEEDYLEQSLVETLPDEFVTLITDILSEKILFTIPGIYVFIAEISSSMYRLSPEQKQALFNAIKTNYHQYNDLNLCWYLGDLVARRYPASQALSLFEALLPSVTKQGEEGIILGLDVIAKKEMRENNDQHIFSEVNRILNSY